MNVTTLSRWIGASLVLVACASCHGTDDPKNTNIGDAPNNQPKHEPAIVDSGQVWFRVSVTKNDAPYMRYEGDWPLLLLSNNSATIQLAESKKLMSITNMLTIYMRGLPATGRVPVVISGRDADKVNMVMSQVIKGNYDIPILPTEGFLNITKNTGTVLSGDFEAKAVDANKDTYLLAGAFLNVVVNDGSKEIKQ